jgi:cytochrome c-type biogenesis protein
MVVKVYFVIGVMLLVFLTTACTSTSTLPTQTPQPMVESTDSIDGHNMGEMVASVPSGKDAMTLTGLVLLPVVFGLVGAITPCALGINTVFLGYVTGKPRSRRLGEWLLFALARAVLLTVLGLAFGLLGQVVGDFVRGYQQFIAWGLIALGVLFILSRFRPLPLPYLNLASSHVPTGNSSTLVMGALFGLDIPACTSPLVLALLAQTVLVGDWLFGAIALFLFGIGMSLPLLPLMMTEGADRWLVESSRRYKTAFYLVAGGLLILFGAAELSPQVMSIVGGWLEYIAEPLLSLT